MKPVAARGRGCWRLRRAGRGCRGGRAADLGAWVGLQDSQIGRVGGAGRVGEADHSGLALRARIKAPEAIFPEARDGSDVAA